MLKNILKHLKNICRRSQMKFKWILSKNKKYLYATHNSTIRADLNGNVYGGGFFSDLFGGGDVPELRVPTAEELFGQGLGWARGQFPEEFAGRKSAVEAIPQLAIGPEFLNRFRIGEPLGQLTPDFFQQFSPTTFEEGLATSAFQPLLEQVKRQAMHIGSLQGIPEVAGAQFAQGISPALLSIGSQLASLQQQRGLSAAGRQDLLAQLGLQRGALGLQGLQSRVSQGLGLDPFSRVALPFTGVGQQQGNIQAQADLQREIEQRRRDQAQAQALFTLALGGAGAGLGAAGFAGLGSLGGFAGSSAGGLTGALQGFGLGSSLGVGDFGSAIGGLQPQSNILEQLLGSIGGGGGAGTALPVGGGGAGGVGSIGSIKSLAGNFGNFQSLLG